MIDDDDDENVLARRQIVRGRVAASLFGGQMPQAGRFEIGAYLGAGAMGTVYASRDEELDRPVAIKVLHRYVSEHSRQRVRREARALARLDHPNVVSVFEVGESKGDMFIVMQRLAGPTLQQWQTVPGRRVSEILDVYRRVGDGLAAAHAAGVVHRDFKPANVIVEDERGRAAPRVVDFGLARTEHDLTESQMGRTAPDTVVEDTTDLTATGAIVGTPAYMAPEQHLGKTVGPAADQFAFCVSLFEALWGHRPFAGQTRAALLDSIQQGRFELSATDRTPPRWVWNVLRRGLSANPAERHLSMKDLMAALDPQRVRRRRRRGLALGALALVAGGWALSVGLARDPCAESDTALAGVWNNERRLQIQRAVEASARDYVVDAWTRTEVALDGYADRFIEEHRDACEATRVRTQQTRSTMKRRMACLSTARLELVATTDLLIEADETTLEHMHRLVRGLADPSRCSDVDTLASSGGIALPGEEDAVVAVRGSLARARALRRAGDASAAVAAAREARRQGLSLSSPVHAEIATELGHALDDSGEYDEAEAVLDEGLRLATAQGQRAVQYEAILAKLWVVGYRQRRLPEALALRPLAEGLSETPRDEALLHARLGWLLVIDGKDGEAETLLRAALMHWTEASGHTAIEVAKTRTNLSHALRAQGKIDEALREQGEAVDVLADALGGGHPDVALARASLGSMLRTAGRYEEALELQREALALFVAAQGDSHPKVASLEGALGSTLYASGAYADAEQAYRRALTITRAAFGDRHASTAELRNNLAAALFAQDELEEGRTHLQTAIEVKQAALGADHPSLARSRDNLGGVLRKMGDLSAAQVEHEAALEIRRKAYGDDHPEVAMSINNLAALAEFSGDNARARQLYRDALRRTIAAHGDDHPQTAKARVNLANVLLAIGQPHEAQPLLEDALRSRRAKLGPEHPEIGEAQLGLGRALLARGDRERALPLLESAHAIFDQADVPDAAKADARAWLDRALADP